MTIMDDYQPSFRLVGVRLLLALLEKVDSKLLKRTGIDSLFFAVSVSRCLPPHRGRELRNTLSDPVVLIDVYHIL